MGDEPIAGTVTAAATAMGEDDNTRRSAGDREVAGQPHATGVDLRSRRTHRVGLGSSPATVAPSHATETTPWFAAL